MAQSISKLPIGAKIKFGKHSINGETAQSITWLVVAKNHSGYLSNTITLLSEKIIDLRAFDAREHGSPSSKRQEDGNNTYSVSNIDQWLNKWDDSWYIAAHSTDAPPSDTYTDSGAGYSTRPGFLKYFDTSERNALVETPLKVMTNDITIENISRKVFLPSLSEIGMTVSNTTVADGVKWEYFSGSNSKIAVLSSQVKSYSNVKLADTTDWSWWLRSAYGYSDCWVFLVGLNGAPISGGVDSGTYGVRPAINLSTTQYVSDTIDSDGCYTMVWNSAPPVPTTLNVPTTINGGKPIAISWGSVTDPDGDVVTYQLEQSINGGAFATIYSGANLSYTTTVAAGSTSAQFRLKAIDARGASSGYITSTNRTVVNNTAPTISGTNSNLGTKDGGFTQTYTVNDNEKNTVTVTEAIDGVAIRSYVVTLGATNTFSVQSTTWISLSNGPHTMTITATDGADTSVRTYTFTKSVSTFAIRNYTPLPASTKPVRIKVTVDREIPVGASFKVEVCRNAYDTNQVWEDATSSVTSNQAHVFQTEIASPSAGKWGVFIRVTVNRNGKPGECWVKSIGGNFE